MDHGTLTDANGKKVDFRNVVLIMTTNAGASDAQRNAIGFGRGKQDDEVDEALKRLFTPEFRNRLDAVVQFRALTPEIIRQVVVKFVMQLEAQLADRHVTIETTDEAADWLAKNGFDELYGARPWPGSSRSTSKSPWPTKSSLDVWSRAATSRLCSRTASWPSKSRKKAASPAPIVERPARKSKKSAPELAD